VKEYLDKIKIPYFIKRLKVDVGLSYNAPVSQKLLEHDSDLFVFGFEPNPNSIDCIVNRGVGYGSPIRLDPKYLEQNRMAIIPVALDDVSEKRQMEFFVTENDPGCSSLHKPTHNAIKVQKKINVDVYPLSDFFDWVPWEYFGYIEWLKIDAQGSDLNILKSAKNYLADLVVYVTAEADGWQYENCESCSKDEIREYMEKIGFIEIINENVSDPTFLNKNFVHLKDKIFLWQK
jgi:hypothetical protein